MAWLNLVPWWAASLLANLCIMGVEYFNHAGNYGSWPVTLLRTGPLIILAQWGLYHAFSGATHWLMAWTVFTLGNAVMRICAVYLLQGNQVGHWGHITAGASVMVLGALWLKEGLR